MPHLSRVVPDGATVIYVWFQAMHTRVDILLKSHRFAEKDLLGMADGIQTIVSELEKAGNRFDPESEIWHLNHFPAGEEIEISETLFEMLSMCMRYNSLTQGLFDISVSSPLYEPGFLKNIHLKEGRKFSRDREDIILDLSGFIKGYALDRIRTYLENKGITDALINMGNSSIMAFGNVPGPVKNGCLTTSGNSDSTRRHIRNPLTGAFVTRPGTAQVVTRGGAEGEVKATVSFIKGPE